MPRCAIVGLSVLLHAALCQPLVGQTAAPVEAAELSLRDAARQSAGVVDLVRALTSEIGGRLPGSAADRAARAWIIERLRAAGVDTIWEQPVPVSTWVRGPEYGWIEQPRRQRLALAAFGFSPATPDSGVSADVVAYPSARAVLQADSADLRGRIVFIDRPMVRVQDGRGYLAVVQQRPEAIARAAASGAAAVLVRSPGTSPRAVHVSNLAAAAGGATRIPVGALSNASADLLRRALDRGSVRLRVRMGGAPGPAATSANIVAAIHGTELRDVVLLGAHHDAWDLGSGAIDDGAGVAIVLTAAHHIARAAVRPRRSIRFVFFAAEEQFLGGARVYAAGLDSSARHVLAIEPDQGGGAPYRVRAQLPAAWQGLLEYLGALLLPMGIDALSDPSVAGPDLIPLRERGVPTIDVAQDMTELWDAAHSANDTFAAVRPDALRAAAAAYAVVAYAAANWRAPLAGR